tara:strand:+ start:24 stop:599 length:576 start_codon:yes stop_codon:yes gene_type:complete
MGEDAILQIGAVDLAWGDLWPVAIAAFIAGGIRLAPWASWHLRDWRIRRAVARGDTVSAKVLAISHDESERPRSITHVAAPVAAFLIGPPALMVFQINFAHELERMLGEGWGFASMLFTIALVTGCAWAWEKVKRNAMSPAELAELEEEEEYRRWLRSIEGDIVPGILAAIVFGAAILAGFYFLFAAITPG